MNKTCFTCKESKELEEFQKRSSSSDGYAGTCKVCKRTYDNAHYQRNKETRRLYIKSNSKKRVEQNREWIKNYLIQNPCIDCGEPDLVVLEFDHRENKTENISSMINRHTLKRIQLEVAKCDVRCANCHRRKTAKDFGWWKA